MPSPPSLPSLIRSEVAALNATEGKKRHSKNSSWVVHNAFIPLQPVARWVRGALQVEQMRARDPRNLDREEISHSVGAKTIFGRLLCVRLADSDFAFLVFSDMAAIFRLLSPSLRSSCYYSFRELLSWIYRGTPISAGVCQRSRYSLKLMLHDE